MSYCWGGMLPIRTLRSNIRSHINRIPWCSVSSGFKTAILMCRRLGIPYLWIDLLCIIQDDYQDWGTECQKICDYCSQAYLPYQHYLHPTRAVQAYHNPVRYTISDLQLILRRP